MKTSKRDSTFPRILFYGTPDFANTSLSALIEAGMSIPLVITQPDRPAGRGEKATPPPVKKTAEAYGIPVCQPQSIKKDPVSFYRAIEMHGPFDIAVVIAFGQILPAEILKIPASGSLNVHASLLPRWRGAAPIHRAIMEGDTHTGICLMNMDEGLDTGDVYLAQSIPIEADDTTGSLHDKLARLGARLLVEHLSDIAAGKRAATPQLETGVSYAKKISKKEARLDWSAPAEVLERRIRGLNPFPGAFTELAGKRLKVFRAVLADCSSSGTPGTIHTSGHSGLEVQCGEGILSLQEVQLEGKKRMSVASFLKGLSLSEGMKLGE